MRLQKGPLLLLLLLLAVLPLVRAADGYWVTDGQMSELQSYIGSLKAESALLKESLKKAGTPSENLEKRIKDLEQTLAKSRSIENGLRKSIESMTESLDFSDQKIMNLEGQLKTARGDLTALTGLLEELRESYKRLEREAKIRAIKAAVGGFLAGLLSGIFAGFLI
jgi:chromosome segregation ATPase